MPPCSFHPRRPRSCPRAAGTPAAPRHYECYEPDGSPSVPCPGQGNCEGPRNRAAADELQAPPPGAVVTRREEGERMYLVISEWEPFPGKDQDFERQGYATEALRALIQV